MTDKISIENGNDEAWICTCGNTPAGGGFYPCEEYGLPVGVSAYQLSHLFVCNECGRIINETTLEYVGQASIVLSINGSLTRMEKMHPF